MTDFKKSKYIYSISIVNSKCVVTLQPIDNDLSKQEEKELEKYLKGD